MPDDPDVSIVIATYNEGPYLEESLAEIDAVMAQTRYRYELILVDDASTNGTRDVVQGLGQVAGQPRQVLLHQANQGRGGTVSDGIR
ncbi:MAG: glycosyltransferase, partial [Gemmatimonadota bacterium]